MRRKFYFVKTNAYDMIVSDDGDIRRVLTDSNSINLYSQRERAEDFLREIEDDSSWAEYEETVEELTNGEETEILAEYETENF